MAYAYYATVTVDNTKVSGSANFTDFPIVISDTYNGTAGEPDLRTTANGGKIQNTDSSGGITGGITVPADLAFYSDSGLTTQLKHEFESYSATTGELTVWVKIPTLDYNDDTVIYMAYGDSGVTTSQEDINNVWNSNFEAVYHMTDATTSTIKDSTSNAVHGTKAGANDPVEYSAGKIGKAQDSVNVHTYIDIGTLTMDCSKHSILYWAYPDGTYAGSHYNLVFSIHDSGSNLWENWNWDYSYMTWRPGNGANSAQVAFTHPTGSWHHYAYVSDNTSGGVGYHDTVSKVTYSGTWTGWTSADAWLMCYLNDPFDSGFDGKLDEVWILSTNVSSDFIKTAYNNQNAPATFTSVGSETEAPTSGGQFGMLMGVGT